MREVALKAWGNSMGIRIPSDVIRELNVEKNDIFELSVENDAIILKKRFKHKTFEERLAEYNGEIHITEFDWGEPVGKELI